MKVQRIYRWESYRSSCSLFLSFHDFLLERVWLGESDSNFMSGDLLIDGSHSVNLVFNLLFIKRIKAQLYMLLAIEGDSGRSTGNWCWVALLKLFNQVRIYNYNIFKNCIVHLSQVSASWSLLRLVVLSYKNKWARLCYPSLTGWLWCQLR